MRIWPAALLVLLTARLTVAQPPASATLPPIGLPLPPIGSSLPPIGMAPPTDTTTVPTPQPRTPRGRRRAASRPWVPVIVYAPDPALGHARPGTVTAPPVADANATATPRATETTQPARSSPEPAAPIDTPSEPRPDPPGPRPVSKPLYFVPGCYLGDVPPEHAGLPATCDLTKTVVFRP